MLLRDFIHIKSLVIKEKVLISTFRRLLVIEQQKNKYGENGKKLFAELCAHLENLESQSPKINKIDSFLTSYTFKVTTGMELFSSFSKLVEIAKEENGSVLLQSVWMQDSWMVDVFYFLDVYSQSAEDVREHRV